MVNVPPLPDSTAKHINDDGKPTVDHYTWLKSVQDFINGIANAITTAAIVVGSPTGGQLASGSVNAQTLYENNNEVLTVAGSKTLTGGFRITPHDLGTISSGTVTPDANNGLKQKLVNNGAFNLAPPANDGDVELLVTNGASAGAITFSGFTKQWTGDVLDTTNAHAFVVFIYVIGGNSAYLIKALQ